LPLRSTRAKANCTPGVDTALLGVSRVQGNPRTRETRAIERISRFGERKLPASQFHARSSRLPQGVPRGVRTCGIGGAGGVVVDGVVVDGVVAAGSEVAGAVVDGAVY
jgi:hypothetical protein